MPGGWGPRKTNCFLLGGGNLDPDDCFFDQGGDRGGDLGGDQGGDQGDPDRP